MKKLMYVTPTKANLLELCALPQPKEHELIPVDRLRLWLDRMQGLHLPSRILLAKLNYEGNIAKNRDDRPAFFIPNHPEGRYFKMAVADFEALRAELIPRFKRRIKAEQSFLWIS